MTVGSKEVERTRHKSSTDWLDKRIKMNTYNKNTKNNYVCTALFNLILLEFKSKPT